MKIKLNKSNYTGTDIDVYIEVVNISEKTVTNFKTKEAGIVIDCRWRVCDANDYTIYPYAPTQLGASYYSRWDKTEQDAVTLLVEYLSCININSSRLPV